jgi:hypothetical protein
MTQTLSAQLAVAPDQLRRRVDPAQLPLTTADVPPLEGTIGQPRAVDALAFGLEISSPGYNLFVAGRPARAASAPSTTSCAGSPRAGPPPPTGSTSTTSPRRTAPRRSACRRAGGAHSPLTSMAFCRRPSETSRALSRARTTSATVARHSPNCKSGETRSSTSSRPSRATRALPSKRHRQAS